MADLKRELVEKAPGIARTYLHSIQERPSGGPYVICRSDSGDLDISLFDSSGGTLCGEGFKVYQSQGSPAEVLEALKGQPAYRCGYSLENSRECAIAYPLVENGPIVGVMRLSRPLSEVGPLLRNTYLKIMWVVVSFVLFSIIVNLFFSKPIKQE